MQAAAGLGAGSALAWLSFVVGSDRFARGAVEGLVAGRSIVTERKRSSGEVRHIRMLGLCVVALLALAAVAAVGSASAAEPEWGVCVAQKKGHYEDSNCTKEKFKENKKGEKKYSGKYEWKGGAPATTECFAKKHGNYLTSACDTMKEKKGVPEEGKGKYEKAGPKFTGEGGAGVLKAVEYGCDPAGVSGISGPGNRVPHADCTGKSGFGNSGINATVECATERATGEATGSNEIANVSVRFTGCVTLGDPATTHGLAAGEIQVNELKGKLGYINAANHEVGVLLEPATSGAEFAEFEVLEGEIIEHVGVGNATEGTFYEEATPGEPSGHDGIISPVVPVNQMTHTFTQEYRLETISPYEVYVCSHKVVTCTNIGTPTVVRNTPTSFEGGPLETLEFYQENPTTHKGSVWGPAGEEINNVNTLEGEAEIKA